MGAIRNPLPTMLLTAVFSRHPDALAWARQQAAAAWGAVALASEPFLFDQTAYYERDMGSHLRKQFLAFQTPFDPGELAACKLQTNAWEGLYQQSSGCAERRPLNLDPGYLTEAKLVLASTKDRDHRIYLGQGIFAETTLIYQHGRWQPRPWTYPDYLSDSYHAFFDRCRYYLRRNILA